MKTTAKQYARALWETCENASQETQEKILSNFANLLKEAGQLEWFTKIAREFVKYDRAKRGVKAVRVTFASQDRGTAVIQGELERLIGSKLVVQTRVRPEILGGVIVETEDARVDASVRGKLGKLRNSLIS